jgi:hypothetical protein
MAARYGNTTTVPCKITYKCNILVLLDPLLRCAALVVEGDNALGRTRQVGDGKADAPIQLTRMPLDLGDNTPWLPPAPRLTTEAGEVAAQGHRERDFRGGDPTQKGSSRRGRRADSLRRRPPVPDGTDYDAIGVGRSLD